MNKLVPADAALLHAVREGAERVLTPEEFEAWVNAPMAEDERLELLDLVRWFTTRYPTAGERLAYARRAYARTKRWQPPPA